MSLDIEVIPDPRGKRALDVGLASIALVVTAPLWVLATIAARAQGRGPVFYRQQRWGRAGAPFTVRKFRTMTPSVGQIEPASVADPRVTPIGGVLRRSGLDELPQLLAIIKGEMSFVGPRPLAIGEVVRDAGGTVTSYEVIPGFAERLAVRPGLTGPTTIYLPKDAPPAEKFARDLEYIESRTLWGDVKLILLSIWISLRGRWEDRAPKL